MKQKCLPVVKSKSVNASGLRLQIKSEGWRTLLNILDFQTSLDVLQQEKHGRRTVCAYFIFVHG